MDSAYTFAGASFDPESGSLTVDGRSSNLRPRTAAVLRCLLEHPGQVVSKDQLLKEVWADLVVTENSLAQCIKEIRRELGDTQEALLRTVHRRGYSLEAAVARAGGAGAQGGPTRPSPMLSLVVLPLVNLAGDGDGEYFADGLTEDLTMDVGRIPSAFVIARGTAQTYAGRRVDPREIGRDLGVHYVVEGSVRRDASNIVVNLTVSDTRDAHTVWVERFEEERSNLQAMQRAMAARVAYALHIELSRAEAERAERQGPAQSSAQDLAMRAFCIWHRTAPYTTDEPRELTMKALELDPRCSYAWLMLARVHLMALSTRTATDWHHSLAEAERAARNALAFDPDDRGANGALGAALAFQGRLEEALEALERQMAVNPNEARAQQWLGIVHILMGNAHLAIKPLETCLYLSPRDPRLSTSIRNLALAHLHLGRDGEALIHAERSVHVPRPWPRSYETLAAAYAVNGLMEEARAAVGVLLGHWPGYSIAKHKEEMMSDRPAFLAQRERLLEGLRRAGLPER